MSYLDPVRAALAEELPGLHPDLLDLYTLLALVKGEAVTSIHVHDAWALWTQRRKPDHHDLIPFNELDPDTQALDDVYVQAVRKAASVVVH